MRAADGTGGQGGKAEQNRNSDGRGGGGPPQGAMRATPVANAGQVAVLAALADEIWHECFAGIITAGQIDYMLAKFLSPEAIEAQMREQGYRYTLLEFDDGPGGFVALQPKNGRLLLSKLYLQSHRRGGGYGRQALAFAEETGRALGCHTLWLTVNVHNRRAIAVYEAAGFTRARSQRADIGGGYVMDDYIYEKPV